MRELNFIEIGNRMKQRRKEMHYTQEYVANILGINPSHISNIECGRANPSLTVLVNIANILECSVDCFLSEEYTYETTLTTHTALDAEIAKRLKYCDKAKKLKILKMIDLL